MSSLTSTLSQYYVPTDIKADVQFGEQSQRFDLSHLIKKEEKRNDIGYVYQRADYDNDDSENGELYNRRSNNRRNYRNKLKKHYTAGKKNINLSKPIERRRSQEKRINDLANEIMANLLTGHNYNRRFVAENYAYHDRPAYDNKHSYGRPSHKNHNKLIGDKNKDTKKYKNNLKLKNKFISDIASLSKGQRYNRRNDEVDFAYHDNMNEDTEKLDDENIAHDELDTHNRRLQVFVNKLHGDSKTRRVADPEGEILFHHAFPIDLKVKGFLQLPEN